MINSWADAELAVADALVGWGFKSVGRTSGGADGGVDVRAVGLVCQVKAQMSGATGRPIAQQIAGIAAAESSAAALFSLAPFTAEAEEWSEEAGVALFTLRGDGECRPANPSAQALVLAVSYGEEQRARFAELVRSFPAEVDSMGFDGYHEVPEPFVDGPPAHPFRFELNAPRLDRPDDHVYHWSSAPASEVWRLLEFLDWTHTSVLDRGITVPLTSQLNIGGEARSVSLHWELDRTIWVSLECRLAAGEVPEEIGAALIKSGAQMDPACPVLGARRAQVPSDALEGRLFAGVESYLRSGSVDFFPPQLSEVPISWWQW